MRIQGAQLGDEGMLALAPVLDQLTNLTSLNLGRMLQEMNITITLLDDVTVYSNLTSLSSVICFIFSYAVYSSSSLYAYSSE